MVQEYLLRRSALREAGVKLGEMQSGSESLEAFSGEQAAVLFQHLGTTHPGQAAPSCEGWKTDGAVKNTSRAPRQPTASSPEKSSLQSLLSPCNSYGKSAFHFPMGNAA